MTQMVTHSAPIRMSKRLHIRDAARVTHSVCGLERAQTKSGNAGSIYTYQLWMVNDLTEIVDVVRSKACKSCVSMATTGIHPRHAKDV